jgi:CRP/FNR family transcriptional regulator, polysaccharide utilization system transcription regulator
LKKGTNACFSDNYSKWFFQLKLINFKFRKQKQKFSNMSNIIFDINITSILDLVSEENPDIMMFKKGQLIYFEGNTPMGVFFVKAGKVKIIKSGSCGREQIIRILMPGEIINSCELFTNQKFSATAKAIEDSTLIFIGIEKFKAMMKQYPVLSEQFIIHLSNELLKADEKIAGLSYKSVKVRIAEALISLSENNQQAISISRKDLASYVGTAKETLNRFISEFNKEGIISIGKNSIKIINLAKLKTYSF